MNERLTTFGAAAGASPELIPEKLVSVRKSVRLGQGDRACSRAAPIAAEDAALIRVLYAIKADICGNDPANRSLSAKSVACLELLWGGT